MFGTKIIFGIALYPQHFHKKILCDKLLLMVKSDGSNIGPKLESVTTYNIKFIIKLLKKYCGCNITLIFVRSNFF